MTPWKLTVRWRVTVCCCASKLTRCHCTELATDVEDDTKVSRPGRRKKREQIGVIWRPKLTVKEIHAAERKKKVSAPAAETSSAITAPVEISSTSTVPDVTTSDQGVPAQAAVAAETSTAVTDPDVTTPAKGAPAVTNPPDGAPSKTSSSAMAPTETSTAATGAGTSGM